LRDLHVFFAVVQSGIKAATQSRVKQPSVSKAIGDLEGVLGVRHFDRSPQGVRPTIYGDALIECGVAVFQLKQRSEKSSSRPIRPPAMWGLARAVHGGTLSHRPRPYCSKRSVNHLSSFVQISSLPT
jgi:DNA-binding transcriptional LysR family regulator